jgi:hypothetical protein
VAAKTASGLLRLLIWNPTAFLDTQHSYAHDLLVDASAM